ncbi:hypothetical protein RHSIM_Rhsim03G0113200 [Rhododendron simsii]|uniref:Uncharacterized protein n=1 Tax=Rhododendron simsii TaxID=118357 RepID=A0A834LQ83_RHOSS|nr:hypothetical protein RHSIM_Rhsim03G0113200 [Rhododendron simsii]
MLSLGVSDVTHRSLQEIHNTKALSTTDDHHGHCATTLDRTTYYFTMSEIQNYTNDDNNVNTGIVDGVVNEKLTVINIENPSIGARVVGTLFRRKALMIDQCKLRYKPQCPVNATGIVEVRIFDTHVHGKAAIQARFAFPVTCLMTITYFGTAFAIGDTTICPWEASYHLSNTNLKRHEKYCKLRASLSFSTHAFLDEVEFRPPIIEVNSKIFTANNVDVWYCERTTAIARLSRTLSTISLPRTAFLTAPMGQYGSTTTEFMAAWRSTSVLEHPIIENNNEDPEPSASQVGSHNSCVTFDDQQMERIVKSAGKAAVSELTSPLPESTQPKHPLDRRL